MNIKLDEITKEDYFQHLLLLEKIPEYQRNIIDTICRQLREPLYVKYYVAEEKNQDDDNVFHNVIITNLFIFSFIKSENNNYILYVYTNVDCKDIRTIMHLGMVLGQFYEPLSDDESIIGLAFKLADCYSIKEMDSEFEIVLRDPISLNDSSIDVDMENNAYLEEIVNNITNTMIARKMNEKFTEEYLKNVDINKIPSC